MLNYSLNFASNVFVVDKDIAAESEPIYRKLRQRKEEHNMLTLVNHVKSEMYLNELCTSTVPPLQRRLRFVCPLHKSTETRPETAVVCEKCHSFCFVKGATSHHPSPQQSSSCQNSNLQKQKTGRFGVQVNNNNNRGEVEDEAATGFVPDS